jgi:hypothetical protein
MHKAAPYVAGALIAWAAGLAACLVGLSSTFCPVCAVVAVAALAWP